MLAQHARRTRLKTSDKGATLAEVVDARLSQHGVDMEKISWDAYRRDDGTWRVVATWPSGKANATAIWELDKARQLVAPQDDMAHYLCGAPIAGRAAQRPRGRARPGRTAAGTSRSSPAREPARPGRDPIRTGRDALHGLARASTGDARRPTRSLDPNRLGTGRRRSPSAAASGEVPRRRVSARGAVSTRTSATAAIEMPGGPVARRAAAPPHRAGRRPRRRPAGQARPELGRRALRRRAHRQGRLSPADPRRLGWRAWSTRIWAGPACP